MSSDNIDPLHRIAGNLRRGLSYATETPILNPAIKPPLWHVNLWFRPAAWSVAGHDLWGASHYGSSHWRANLKNLRWILRNWFKQTASEFERTHVLLDENERAVAAMMIETKTNSRPDEPGVANK